MHGFPSAVESHFVHGVTAAATSSKVVLLGYDDGSVALFDVYGNPLDLHKGRHSGAVVAVSLGGGQTLDDVAASAGLDGIVRANSLFDNPASRPSATLSTRGGLRTRVPCGIAAIAVDPEYGKPRSGERVAYADNKGRVALHTAGWFGGTEVALVQSGARVYCMSWLKYLLAWATSAGVSIYDCRIKQMVCFVEPPVVAPTDVVSRPHAFQTSTTTAEESQSVQTLSRSNDGNRDPSRANSEENEGESHKVSQNRTDCPSEKSIGRVEHESVDHRPFVANKADDKLDSSTVNQAGPGSAAGHREDISKEINEAIEHSNATSTKISLFFEQDDNSDATKYGERTQTLYISWPTVAKAISIGPHIETLGDGADPPAPRDRPPRDIQTALAVYRDKLLAGFESNIDDSAGCRIMGIAPFGKHVAILLMSDVGGLILAKMQTPGEDLVQLMHMQYRELLAAEMFAILGGEPLLLISVQFDIAVDDTAKKRRETMNCAEQQQESPAKTLSEGCVFDLGHCVFFARALSVAERVNWLLDNGQFAEALKTAEEAPLGSLSREDVSIAAVGDHFLDSIAASGEFDRLAQVLPQTISSTSPAAATRGRDKAMRNRRERWEKWINVFRSANKLSCVAPLVPCYEPQLAQSTYNQILTELLEANSSQLLHVLKTWPSHVYHVPYITRAVEARLSPAHDSLASAMSSKDGDLRECLLALYGISGRHDETLNLLLRETSHRIFTYVKSHNLYEAIRSDDTLSKLFTIDEGQAIELLVNAPCTVLPPETVVPILKHTGNLNWLCHYLHSIFRMDPDRAPRYHPLLLELLIQVGPHDSLYNFLRTSSHFSLDKALHLMEKSRGNRSDLFRRERVYVLATMGDLGSAMDVLLNELHDVHGAIEFASENDDMPLWDRLIDHARDDVETLAALLDSPAGGKVNPIQLVPLISSDMEIPHLRDRLHRILVDAASERALREQTASALRFDASQLMDELDKAVAGAVPDSSC